MYYWSTNFYLNSDDDSIIEKNRLEKLYVKVMDLDWHAVYQAYPVTSTDLGANTVNCEIVPVVFMTNESVLNTPVEGLDTLAKKIVLKTKLLCQERYDHIKELQIDCDWTPKSKDKYFELLKKIKSGIGNRQLSVTLRLHQLKYRSKTGIPPADRVMLMLYNMGKVQSYEEENSILNLAETKKYLVAGHYPVKMDFALPTFNWGVKFSGKHFERIIHHVNKTTFDTCKAFVKQENGMYRMTEDYRTINDSYYYYGDEIRVEDVTKENLLELVQLCKKQMNTKKFSVVFFELQSYYTKSIDPTSYEEIYTGFN